MANLKKYSFWIAVVLTLAACVYAFYQFLLPLDVFLWDESHHGFFGMQIYNDLKAGNWGRFWQHTNNQALWMPLHSWLDGIFLYLFGFSYAAARSSSLFLFFLCSLLVFLIGQGLNKERGWLIGLISIGLFLTSPIILSLATLNMQEMLGMFMLLLLVYFMVRFMALEVFWKYLIIGFLIGLAYWSKSNYALQLIFAIGLFQLSLLWGINRKVEPVSQPSKKKRSKKQQPKAKGRNKLLAWFVNDLLIIAGFLPLFALWWATPPFNRKYALGFLFRTQGVGEALFYPGVNYFGRVIFYLQSLISSYTFSFWLGLACLIALGCSFCFFGDKKIRLAVFVFLANLIMISSVGNIQERYISTAAPMLFVLLAYLLVIYAPRLKELKKYRAPAVVIGLLLMAMIGYDALSLTRYTKEVANRSILFFIYKDSLNRFSPPFLFGLAKRPAFTYPMAQTKKYADFRVKPTSSLQQVLDYFSLNIDKGSSISALLSYHELSPYVIYWHFQGWGAPVYTINDFYAIKTYFWYARYFIELEPLPGSPYEVDRLVKGWKEIPILLKSGYIKLVKSKEFTDLGLVARIYKRVKNF